jgi:hypothetical protein
VASPGVDNRTFREELSWRIQPYPQKAFTDVILPLRP